MLGMRGRGGGVVNRFGDLADLTPSKCFAKICKCFLSYLSMILYHLSFTISSSILLLSTTDSSGAVSRKKEATESLELSRKQEPEDEKDKKNEPSQRKITA